MGKRGLGRGLAALISENTMRDGEARVQEVPVSQVTPNPYQPRTLFDPIKMEELVTSIKEHGVLQPILLREVGHERFQIVAGERRFRAAQTAGLTQVPAIVKECSERELLEMAVVENVQREDIGAMEAARAYRRMIDEFHMTQETVSHRVGKSRSSVANLVRLLDLPDVVQDSLERNQLSEGHGKALLKLRDHPELLERAWRRAATEQLSVRATEQVIELLLTPSRSSSAGSSAEGDRTPASAASNGTASFSASDPHEAALAGNLQDRLGTRVFVRRDGKGRGRIEIEFYTEEDLQRVFDLLLETGRGR